MYFQDVSLSLGIESMFINKHFSSRILITKLPHGSVALLSTFAKFLNATVHSIISPFLFLSVWLSGHIDQSGSDQSNCHKILYLVFFENVSRKCKNSLKSDKSSEFFTCRPICNCDHILLISSQNDKLFQTIVIEEIKTQILHRITFLRKSYR